MRTLVVWVVVFFLLVSQAGAGWKIALIGDTRGDAKTPNADNSAWLDRGVNTVILADLGAALRAEDVLFVIHLGDLVSKWKRKLENVDAATLVDEELALFVETWITASDNLILIPIRGNHEATPGGGAGAEDLEAVWKSYFPDLPQNGPEGSEGFIYSFKFKNVLFVGLDQYVSESGGVTPVDLDWIEGELSRTAGLQKIVFGHAPAFPSTDPDLPDIHKAMPSPDGELLPEAQEYRDQFWNLLGEQGVQAYFTAHEHLYARAIAPDESGNELRQVIVGCGGAPLDPYPQVLSVENYDISDPLNPVPLDDPRVIPEAEDISTGMFGYLLVEVKGPAILATYKAKAFEFSSETGWSSVEGAEYEILDEWSLRIPTGRDVEEGD